MISASEPRTRRRLSRAAVLVFTLSAAHGAAQSPPGRPAPAASGRGAAPSQRGQAAAPDEDVTRNAARELARQGLELMNAGNFAEAEDLFRRAYELVPAPTVAVLRGRALDKLDRLVEAAESYEAARRVPKDATTPEAFRDAAREAEALLAALKPQIPQVTLMVNGVPADYSALEVKIDDMVVPSALLGVKQPVNPGQHLVTVAIAETVHDSRWIRAARAQNVRVLLRVEPPREQKPLPAPPKPPPPPPEPRLRTSLGWGAVGLGGAGFLTGLAAGIVMLEHKAELDRECRPGCPEQVERDLATFRTTRTISAMGYGVGFLGVGLGAGLLLTTPGFLMPEKPHAARRPSLRVSPTGIAVEGTFR